ncbi:MAG: hydantoinase/oxoprolinase family protein [Deltaproteobacteria bacterium]|nr:hydantoinase/oxoprolinase family protein [Deltaproteobacteria bacterium]
MNPGSSISVVDIDIGGTFTDIIFSSRSSGIRQNGTSSKGFFKFLKVETTPHDLGHCVRDALEQTVQFLGLPDLRNLLAQVETIRLSTSLSTNLLLEHKGPRCGLLISKDWKTKYLAQYAPNEQDIPFVEANLVVEVSAEMGSEGNTNSSISEEDVRHKTHFLLEQGATVIVVSLSGTEKAVQQENEIKRIIHKYYQQHCLGSVPVLTATQVNNGFDYLLKTNTALFNAYCQRDITAHFYKIEDYLRQEGYTRPLLVVNSSGETARVAKTKAVQTINSGAAAGIFGVSKLAEVHHCSNLVSVDIGGTSTEIGMLRSGKIKNVRPAFLGAETTGRSPLLDITFPVLSTLGIGGSSTANINNAGNLVLGPESAGAFPGPICYDLGGSEPTLTDAYLILGYLDPQYYLGGKKILHIKTAQKIMTRQLALPLNMSCEEVAFQLKSKAVELIGNEIKKIELQTETPLFALGGGGGCLGVDLAEYAGLSAVYVFRQSSVFGAFGSSCMNIVHTFESQTNLRISPHSTQQNDGDSVCRSLNETIIPLQHKAFQNMRSEGFSAESIRFELELELKSESIQETEKSVEYPDKIDFPNIIFWSPRDWPLLLQKISTHFDTENLPQDSFPEVQISKIILKATGQLPHSEITPSPVDLPLDGNLPPVISGTGCSGYKGGRSIYVGNGRRVKAKVYEWDLLSVPGKYFGPAVIESPDTALWIPEKHSIVFDEQKNGIIQAVNRA